ncbi:ned1 [Candida theae]|uniref:Ned1 n=1 Tax=Candida theae TaxID=1198502 RepID=A0AAD5BFZ6_9ASCO|nr:ned1 [Candida theae]KAI5959984.1 ned1 [Candida theae]
MQYVGKVGGYVYNQWNSLNPATLSGAIDVIVIEHPDGTRYTSPWHVRFGLLQIIKPSQKKIDLYVNDVKTNLPMKLGEGGEAHFVFEVNDTDHELSNSVLTSPLISPVSSPLSTPANSDNEPDYFDLDEKTKLSDIPSPRSPSQSKRLVIEDVKKITQKLNIPTKIDLNGDILVDMDGYKPNSQKNIDNSDELFKKILLEEIEGDLGEHSVKAWNQIITKDESGNIRISNAFDDDGAESDEDVKLPSTTGTTSSITTVGTTSSGDSDKVYFKTLRLTSEQLQMMSLNYGVNTLKFKSRESSSQVTANLFLWKSTTPIVISDIDGTITKSDALGHVLNLIGRDWTHPGVASLFQEINQNGYNILYLTARSVGQADSTRQYLTGVNQDGVKLPSGPVILSPDRTFAALRREVVLKKPEVFKMACLSDIMHLFFEGEGTVLDEDDDQTPFYAGFGNRITDAISYRSVHIPSHRIFTINPDGEVHMELLELAGYKSSYLHIGELVDQFFPPIRVVSSISTNWNNAQWSEYVNNHELDASDARSITSMRSPTPGSPRSPRSPGSPRNYVDEYKTDEKFNDVNYWKNPLDFDDLSDSDIDKDDLDLKNSGSPKLKKNEKLSHRDHEKEEHTDNPELLQKGARSKSPALERPLSASSFTSPLKNFMSFRKKKDDEESYKDAEKVDEDDFTDDDDEEDDEGDDDYTDDDYDDDDYDEEDYDEEEEEDEGEGEGEGDDSTSQSSIKDVPVPEAVRDEIIDRGSTEFIKASDFQRLNI